jgi:hypothetical protein
MVRPIIISLNNFRILAPANCCADIIVENVLRILKVRDESSPNERLEIFRVRPRHVS